MQTATAAHFADLRRRLLATRLKPSRIARLAGLSAMGLRHLKNPDWSCTVKTAGLLEAWLARWGLDGSAAVVHADNITDVSLDVCAENHSGAPRCGAATSEPQ